MSIILSFVLMSFATISFLIAFNVLRSSARDTTHNIYLFIYCISSCLWSISCAVMGLSENIEYAYFMRSLMLVGVFLVLNVCIQLFCIWLDHGHKKIIFYRNLLILLSLVVFPMIITKNNVEFVDTPYGKYYRYSGITFGRGLFTLYLVCWTVFVLCITLYGLHKSTLKRKKFMGRIILLCLAMMVFGSISDIFLPMFGFAVFPTCAMEQFFSVILIYIVSNYYNVSQITIKNISEYIYRVVETPMVVTGEDGAIEIVNASAAKFFEVVTDRLIGTDFLSLFEISEKDSVRARREGVMSVHTDGRCLLNGARCSLSISHIYDRFDDLIGDIIVITDLTDKLEMIDELNRSREKAIQATEAKNAFLANISHEIRTPLNAIIGMSEILMNRQLPYEIRDELKSIYSASKSLTATINDFLDYSKIEMGHFEIVEREYEFSELMFDIINIISMRLIGKPVYFFVEVQFGIPMKLIGDDIRIRQILINILGNAVKFTSKGYIKLLISMERQEDDRIKLQMTVEDTGIGIREEDLPMLFQRFSQVDQKRNSYITGTGLGLAITKDLVEMMDGNIQVESTYGKGTTFCWTIYQKIEELPDYEQLQIHWDRSFIVYEEEKTVKEYLMWIMKQLKIEYTIIDSKDYIKGMDKKVYFMTRNIYYDKLAPLLKPYHLGKHLIVILGIGDSKNKKLNEHHQFFMPLLQKELKDLYLSICSDPNVCKRKEESKDILSLPDAKVLVVDDNETNLVIAQGLLSSYQIQADRAMSGKEAIEMAKCKKYHLIFLDQMMPVMDGFETLMQIRRIPSGYYQRVPIIALSAYAMKNAKQHFMEQGFTDFLAKPIEIRHLEHLLMIYLENHEELQNEERTNVNQSDNRVEDQVAVALEDGVNMNQAGRIDMVLAMEALGGNETLYRMILDTYYKDLLVKRKEIPQIIAREDIHLFTIQVHAIKSASKSVGAKELAIVAEYFEGLGKENQTTLILSEIHKLYQEMDELIPEIERILEI
ncbi:MAG: ATP-binding protein [Clostridiales bacterium]|nr:ATP-binding protein [Clostridiales bacterium]